MKKFTNRFFAMMIIMVMVLGLGAVPAFAAANKVIKNQDFTTERSVADRKATVIKKGAYHVTVKSGQGYLKFKAPQKGRYTFTFSKVRTPKFGASSFVETMKVSPYNNSNITMVDVSTKGGKYNTLWMSVNGTSFPDRELKYRPIASRTGTVSLKKGEPFYMYFYTSSGKATFNLVIKKK